MAIRNVNGRNVYVLDPIQPTGKTTSGRNWATLYSDLRWQVWEEIQKNEAAMLKMELSSAKMRKDYYDDKIKVLQDQRKQLQAASLRGERGDPGSANRDYLAGARILQRNAEATSKQTRTKITPEFTFAGETIPESRQITETVREGAGLPRETFEGLQRRMRLMDQELEAPAEGIEVAPAGLTIDQQIEALDKDLEQLLLQRQTATSGLDADLLRRTREGFAEQVGVMGQGGGIFGLAPRRRRTAPYVQQELAQERIDQFTAERAEVIDRAVSDAAAIPGQINRLRGLAAELEAIGLGGEGGEADMLYREADQLEATRVEPEEAGRAADEAILNRIRESPEFTPRRAGELLLRDRPRRPAGEFEPPRITGQEEVSSPVAIRRAEKTLETIDRGLEPLRGPVPPISEMGPADPAPTDDDIASGAGEVTVEPAPTDDDIVFGPGEVTVQGQAALGGGYVFDGQSGIIFGPTGFPVFSTLPQQVPANVEAPKVVSDGALRGIAQRIRQSGGDISAVSGYQSKEAKPEDFEFEEEEFPMEPAGPPQGSSRQRKDKYKFDVVSEGTKLARTPKKLQRLAKTNLPEENRPEHYVIVDKLYDVNRGKAEAFKMTYDEISRAFQNDPQKRSDAHKYLVAKDILEEDVSEPLA